MKVNSARVAFIPGPEGDLPGDTEAFPPDPASLSGYCHMHA